MLGELTAKRLALQRAEAFALALAPFVNFVATLCRPVIWLLGASTNVLVRLLGGDPHAGREEVTDEEIRALVSGSTTLGDEERQIVDDVFDAGARSLREVMLPRTEVDFLPGDMPAHKAVREVLKAPHSRYPVMGESADDIIGFVHVRDLLDPEVSTRTTPVSEVARPVVSFPDTVRVLYALSEMRRTANHLAIVLDEYGGTAGIVTMEDLVEELVGDITDEYDVVTEDRTTIRGDQVIDGLTTLDDFAEKTGLVLPDGPYDTLAGYFMAEYGQLPTLNASVEVEVAHGRRAGQPTHPAGAAGHRTGRPPRRLDRRPASRPERPPSAQPSPRPSARRAAPSPPPTHPTNGRTRRRISPRSAVRNRHRPGGAETGRIDRRAADVLAERPEVAPEPPSRPEAAWNNDAHVCQAPRAVVGPAHRRIRCISATSSVRCGSGCRCRTPTTRSTVSPICTRWTRTPSPTTSEPAPCGPPPRCWRPESIRTGRRCSSSRTSPSTPSSRWVLGAYTGFGHASRMTQFKDKSVAARP